MSTALAALGADPGSGALLTGDKALSVPCPVVTMLLHAWVSCRDGGADSTMPLPLPLPPAHRVVPPLQQAPSPQLAVMLLWPPPLPSRGREARGVWGWSGGQLWGQQVPARGDAADASRASPATFHIRM